MSIDSKPYWLIGLLILVFVGCQLMTAEDLLAAPQPYPESIRIVAPEPGDTVYGDSVTICVEVQIQPLLEPGDALDQIDNVRLILNQETVEQSPAHITFDMLAALYDENDRMIARGPAIDRVCWIDLDLAAGILYVSMGV